MLVGLQGLGKTLQTIAFLAYMQTVRGVAGPSLVVVPMSVLSSWTKEFARWAPHLRIVRVHTSTPEDKMRIRKEARSWLPLLLCLVVPTCPCLPPSAFIAVGEPSASMCVNEQGQGLL